MYNSLYAHSMKVKDFWMKQERWDPDKVL